MANEDEWCALLDVSFLHLHAHLGSGSGIPDFPPFYHAARQEDFVPRFGGMSVE